MAVLLAIFLYAALPQSLLLGPRLVVPVLEALLFIPLVLANPRRMTRQNRLLRRLSIALVLLVAASNAVSLGLLIKELVSGGANQGAGLLLAAAQVWLTNVLVFALAFWELDRGGPVVRTPSISCLQPMLLSPSSPSGARLRGVPHRPEPRLDTAATRCRQPRDRATHR